jgi:y4mF family transcriptional regulator
MEQRLLDTPEAVAEAVREGRRAMCLTQAQLAERAGVGRKFVMELEAGHPRAELAKVLAVLRVLNVQAVSSTVESANPTPRSSYADRKPHAIVDDLDSLMGPTDGIVVLPVTLDWSPKKRYDVADIDDRLRMYEAVLNEALDPADLQGFVNRNLLIEAWPELLVPKRVRARWESVFPELAARSDVGSHV